MLNQSIDQLRARSAELVRMGRNHRARMNKAYDTAPMLMAFGLVTGPTSKGVHKKGLI